MYNILLLVCIIVIVFIMQNKNLLEKINFKEKKNIIVLGLILVYVLINRTKISLIIALLLIILFYHKPIIRFLKDKDNIETKLNNLKTMVTEKFNDYINENFSNNEQLAEIQKNEEKKIAEEVEKKKIKFDIFEDLDKMKDLSNKINESDEKIQPFKEKIKELRSMFEKIKNENNS